MKSLIILSVLFYSSISTARTCPVACSFISDEGIPAAGCGENRQMALLEGMANCVELVKDAMKKSDIPLGTYVLDSCKIKNTRYRELDCMDYAAWDAFEKMWMDKTCHIWKKVTVLGIPLWASYGTCGDEYLPKYNYSGGKYH